MVPLVSPLAAGFGRKTREMLTSPFPLCFSSFSALFCHGFTPRRQRRRDDGGAASCLLEDPRWWLFACSRLPTVAVQEREINNSGGALGLVIERKVVVVVKDQKMTRYIDNKKSVLENCMALSWPCYLK